MRIRLSSATAIVRKPYSRATQVGSALALMFSVLPADRASMEQKPWPATGVGPSHDDDRFLFLLSLVAVVLGVVGVMLYVALR
jgi:hypothetical protein